jgi:hypothetical protein
LKKDNCPNGDFSPSYYDGICNDITTGNVETGLALSNNGNPADDEIQTAYDWAFQHNITTLQPLEKADPEGLLLRSHMAKIVVNYVVNVA